MKKIFLSMFALCMAMVMQAKVGYVMFTVDPGECSAIECYVPWEGIYSPERQSVLWFKANYVDANTYGEGKFLYIGSDVPAGAVPFTAENIADVDVLWIPVGRKIDNKENLLNLLPNDEKVLLENFVKSGKNVFLSGFATQFVHTIGRLNVEPNVVSWGNEYCNDCSDTWSVRLVDSEGHALFSRMGEIETAGEGWKKYTLLSGTGRNDRNCLWNYESFDINNFNTAHTCAIRGCWGNDGDPHGAGLVEFFPTGDWKGTIMVNGLAAYQWGENNGSLENVKNLTRGILDYLSPKSNISWNALEKSSIRISELFSVPLSLQNVPEGSTITYTSNNPLVANVGSDGAGVYGNHFGAVTFHAEVIGDGWHAPKAKIWEGNSAELTVNGGSAAQYAYVLPYSMHMMSNYDNEETYRPDFVSADWFNTTYLSNNTGCFLNPKSYSAENPIPSEVQVLWIHNDHVGLESWAYYDALGGDSFTAALQAFINRGGCVFVSKQATRLIGDLGLLGTYEADAQTHKHYPSYNNGGYEEDRGPWGLKNRFFEGGVDYSTHPVYANLGINPDIMSNGKHTDNNCILFPAENLTQEQVSAYETEHNCRLLGSWKNDGTDYDGGVFAEFLPRATAQGTIIMLGAAAYQWTGRDIEDVDANIKTLTSNILSYLASDPNNTYSRTVPAEHYGTICLPRASASLSDGMTVYQVLSSEGDGIMLEKVNAMEPGVPYFFYSTAEQITVTMTGAPVPAPQNGNGLIGNFGPASEEIPNDPDNYILGSDNTLYYIDQEGIMLGANRAYLDRSAINAGNPSNMPKRIMKIHSAPSVTTALDNTGLQDMQPLKKLVNGRLVIQRGEQIYDVTGTQVK